MLISDRVFDYIRKKGLSQKEFSVKTGIPQSTISDWKKKKANPSSDKILIICDVLGITPVELLADTESEKYTVPDHLIIERGSGEYLLIQQYRSLEEDMRGRLIGYADALAEFSGKSAGSELVADDSSDVQ